MIVLLLLIEKEIMLKFVGDKLILVYGYALSEKIFIFVQICGHKNVGWYLKG